MPESQANSKNRDHKSCSPAPARLRNRPTLPLSDQERVALPQVEMTYPVKIPQYYLNLIDWTDPDDPIRLQTIPQLQELVWHDGELPDPIGDDAHSPVPRLTHRYPDRVLLFPTFKCAVYCRHCFRKESLGALGFEAGEMEQAFHYISEHPEVQEVILTGGDPLILPDANLLYLRQRVEQIRHVRMLRIHTRVPVVVPSRVTPQLIDALKASIMVSVVTHFNHPKEITEASAAACGALRAAGFMLLNQTVLLRGVNDNVQTLQTLCRELVYRLGVKPYYIHHCDLTRGVSHFRTRVEDGLALMRQLRGFISGVALPTYVLDLPGGKGKIPLGPGYVQQLSDGTWLCRTVRGESVTYREILGEAAMASVAR